MASETATMYFDSVNQGLNQEMRALKDSDGFKKKSRIQQEADVKALEARQAAKRKKTWMAQQALTMSNIVMNTADAVMNFMTLKPPNPALAVFAGAMGLAQLAIVDSQKMPAFARGGDFITNGPQPIMVGDNPGGRERVQVTPLSSPNIDGPQDRSSINVNITGNVLTSEFTQEQILPAIKDAIRRGDNSLDHKHGQSSDQAIWNNDF